MGRRRKLTQSRDGVLRYSVRVDVRLTPDELGNVMHLLQRFRDRIEADYTLEDYLVTLMKHGMEAAMEEGND